MAALRRFPDREAGGAIGGGPAVFFRLAALYAVASGFVGMLVGVARSRT